MQTITCNIKDLATICADLTKNGIVFEARTCDIREGNDDEYIITITGF
tara:strand:- start:124 stop:267 length:144 start_codon:yes stop_codon:yes gene_type:complete